MVNKTLLTPSSSERPFLPAAEFETKSTGQNQSASYLEVTANDEDLKYIDTEVSPICSIGYNSTIIFSWKIGDVAKKLNHPSVNGQRKLFKFLREEGVFDGTIPLQEFIDKGYFSIKYYQIPYSIYCNCTPMVSYNGVDFIKALVLEKIGIYKKVTKCTKSGKSNKLTNIHKLLR